MKKRALICCASIALFGTIMTGCVTQMAQVANPTEVPAQATGLSNKFVS